jgi:hypothetical protein
MKNGVQEDYLDEGKYRGGFSSKQMECRRIILMKKSIEEDSLDDK